MSDPANPQPGPDPASGAPTQPIYVDPVTGAPVYQDPITGQYVYAPPGYASAASPQTQQTPGPQTAGPQTGAVPPGAVPPGAPPPGYWQPGFPEYPQAPMPYYVTPKTNSLAVSALVVSIAGGLACGLVGGIVGAILGHVARRQIAERGENGAGMALAAIIVGWSITGLTAILFAIGISLSLTSNG